MTKVKIKNEKVTVDMKINDVDKTYIYKVNTGESYEYIDKIDYKGKTKETLEPGNDISIGTEKFRVFYNQDGVIKAMPFYNLKLDSNPIRQALEEEANLNQEGESKFSISKYWTSAVSAIEMNDSRNLIQKYISAYKTVLKNIGTNDLEVRVPIKNDFSDEVNFLMRLPSRLGSYWIGTGRNGGNDMYYMNTGGAINPANHESEYGVRPIIIIEY